MMCILYSISGFCDFSDFLFGTLFYFLAEFCFPDILWKAWVQPGNIKKFSQQVREVLFVVFEPGRAFLNECTIVGMDILFFRYLFDMIQQQGGSVFVCLLQIK